MSVVARCDRAQGDPYLRERTSVIVASREVIIRPHIYLGSIACLALFVWPFPDVEAHAQAIDTTVAPGDDFFAYANRAWLQSAAIPAGRERWTVRDDIAARTRAQVASIIDA